MLLVALPIIGGNASYRCQCTIEGALNDIGTACYRWQYTLQISRYKFFICYRWCCMLQIALYVTGALYITRWHCKLQLALHVTGNVVGQRYCRSQVALHMAGFGLWGGLWKLVHFITAACHELSF